MSKGEVDLESKALAVADGAIQTFRATAVDWSPLHSLPRSQMEALESGLRSSIVAHIEAEFTPATAQSPRPGEEALTGRQLLEMFSEEMPPNPHFDGLTWDDFEPEGRAVYERVAARIALASPLPVGDWVLVPREPTSEMIGAGGVAMFKSDLATAMNPREGAIAVYRAMLEASSLPVDGGGDAIGSPAQILKHHLDDYSGDDRSRS